jgi:pheromone shutdown protein TraB
LSETSEPSTDDAPVPDADADPVAKDQAKELESQQPHVLVLGTAHVVPITNAVQHHIFEFDPDSVALELDAQRLRGLMTDPENRESAGFGYGLIQKFQQRVADDMGGEVGEEMLAAREAGMLLDVPVALVDKPARQTLQRLLDEMSWGERLKMAWSLLRSWLPGANVEEELQRALDGDPQLVQEVAEKFPTIKRVLIDERDEHMAERVEQLVEDYPRVVLVVGDAHVPGIVEILGGAGIETDTVRVKELRDFSASQATFTVGANTSSDPAGTNTNLGPPPGSG